MEQAHYDARNATGQDHEQEPGDAVDDVERVHQRERVVVKNELPRTEPNHELAHGLRDGSERQLHSQQTA